MSFLRRLLDFESHIGFQHHDIGILAGVAVALSLLGSWVARRLGRKRDA
jgi:hypothetical protein